MKDKDELSKIVGFEIPINRRISTARHQDIVDFKLFRILYENRYGRVKIYSDLESRFGQKSIDLLGKLS